MTNSVEEETLFNAQVAFVIDEYTVAINRGKIHNVMPDQQFLVYALSAEEIKDPATGRSLGRLELVKGSGIIISVQKEMSILKSDNTEKQFSRGIDQVMGLNAAPKKLPFDNPKIGDLIKPIKLVVPMKLNR